MSKGITIYKNCGDKVEGDFLELCKKVIAGHICSKCGSKISKVDNITKKEEIGNENNNDD